MGDITIGTVVKDVLYDIGSAESWYDAPLFKEAQAQIELAGAAQQLGLLDRARGHVLKAKELQKRDMNKRVFEEFPQRFDAALAGHGRQAAIRPIAFERCPEDPYCRLAWFGDAVPIRVFGAEVFRSPGWMHLRQVRLDSAYVAPEWVLYPTLAVLLEVVPRESIMILEEQEHQRKPLPRPDPLLVVGVGGGFYLIGRWR